MPKKSIKNKDKSPAKEVGIIKNNSKAMSIIYCALAILVTFLIVEKGENVWKFIHSSIFGIFGIFSILLPVLFLYLAFLTSKSAEEFPHKKLAEFSAVFFVISISTLFFLINKANFENNEGYFTTIAKLFKSSYSAESLWKCGTGSIGSILGWPALKACGRNGAIVIFLIIIIAYILILIGISANDLARVLLLKPTRKVIKTVKERKGNLPKKITKKLKHTEYSDEFVLSGKDDADKKPNTPETADGLDNIDNVEDIDIDTDDDTDEFNATKSTTKTSKKSTQNTTTEDCVQDNIDNEADNSQYGDSYNDVYKHILDNDDTIGEPIYQYPPVQLLNLTATSDSSNASAELKNNGDKLIDILQSFGVGVSISHISRGPSVTRYELQPAPGVKISRITNLADDIALGLAANGVRIEAPIPGKSAVGIEIPNRVIDTVSIRELLDSEEFKNAKSKLTSVLGKDISGNIVVTNLADMPHLLIAGTTGSGKSVCVNSILLSILYKATPDEVKLLLIDPKMVEFSKYKGIPHLLVPVVSDAKKAAGALNWAVSEMLQRYQLFAEYECKNIFAFNDLVDQNKQYINEHLGELTEDGQQVCMQINGLPVPKENMTQIVIAIDELSDLMMAAPSDVEDAICRLAQMARAAGMHLVIATQRPSVNVITGLIKANIPSRIALKVSSQVDSRTILDYGGAEKLIGRGDMLFAPVGIAKPMRVQGGFASDEEIERVTTFIKKNHNANYNAEIEEKIRHIAAEEINTNRNKNVDSTLNAESELDAKMEEAIKCVIEAGQASTSMLQRKFKVGYARAGRMIDDMEQMGIVGPYQGSKPREVLMTYNDWLERSSMMGINHDVDTDYEDEED